CRRAAEQRDGLAPCRLIELHSVPSNLVGCSIGSNLLCNVALLSFGTPARGASAAGGLLALSTPAINRPCASGAVADRLRRVLAVHAIQAGERRPVASRSHAAYGSRRGVALGIYWTRRCDRRREILTHYNGKQEGLSPARLAFRKGQQAEHSLARKKGRPIEGGLNTVQLANQPTSAIRSWAAASAAVAGCAGSWSTVAS